MPRIYPQLSGGLPPQRAKSETREQRSLLYHTLHITVWMYHYCYTISHIYGVLHSLPLIHTMHIWDTVIISIMANIYCCTIYGQTLRIISTFIVVLYHTHMEVIVFMWPISITISYTHGGDCVYVAYINCYIIHTWR